MMHHLPTLAASFLDRLFGLTDVSFSDDRATLTWRWDLPLWVWLLIIVGSFAVASWSYRHLLGRRGVRTGLTVVRGVLILFVIALLAGPMLVIRREKVEPDWLLVMKDQSLSMTISDMNLGEAGVEPRTRDQAVREALEKQADVFGPDKLGKDRRIVWLGFDRTTYEIDPLDEVGVTWPQPGGDETAMRTAILQAVQQAGGRPISGIVLLTDGRSPQSTGGELVRRLQQQGVSVFAVPVGAEQMPLDFVVARVDAPERAFINDSVPVTVWLDQYPGDRVIDPSRVTVKLIDTQTGAVLDERNPPDASLREPIRLTTESAAAGPVKWRVEVVYDDPADAQLADRELNTRNNTGEVDVELVDRPLGVLYVDGYPRWEYRYLRNLFIREKSIQSSMLLLSADPGFAQEGDVPITRFPTDAKELEPYDIIVIGDVPANYFSDAQLELIRDAVAVRGKGLLLIGGAQAMPQTYEGSELANLLPMRSPGSVSRIDIGLGPVSIQPTPLAEALQVLQLRMHAGTARDEPTWPANLPPLLWVQNVGELKSSAEVIATGSTAGGERVPFVSRLRYSAGQIVYVGSDDTWRWRYARGDVYFEQFWLQLVRMLARSGLDQQQRATFSVSAKRVDVDQAVVLELRSSDELLTQRRLPRISVAVQREAEDGSLQQMEQVELLLQNTGDDDEDKSVTYRTLWRPGSAGKVTLRVIEPALDDLGLTQTTEVISPDDELRHPTPDPERLAALATATGGRIIPLDQLADLVSLVPNRALRTPDDVSESLWDSWLSLLIVGVLLAVEWIGRKLIRLA